jgi:hypothetical protein
VNLPRPRGPISSELIRVLRAGQGDLTLPGDGLAQGEPALSDEDLQLSLYLTYELGYRGFDGIGAEMEWHPAVLGLRASLEEAFLEALTETVPRRPDLAPEEVGSKLFELAAADEGGLARQLGSSGTADQFRQFAIHRSAYQLKEADPHSWVIPRLEGVPKAALLEVQFDEYGSGRADRAHARLFANAMDALGLDSTYGAYLDRIPGVTLATVNLMSMFGLQRRWRGAIVGHLAMFEITSAEPNRRYANGLRRLGLEEATPFFDEHVEADSVHENIAAYDMAGGLAAQQPGLTADILFGAECLLELEGRWAAAVLSAWERDESSLLDSPAKPGLASVA